MNVVPFTNPDAKTRIVDAVRNAKKQGARDCLSISHDAWKNGRLVGLFASGTRYEIHVDVDSNRCWYYDDTLKHEDVDPVITDWVRSRCLKLRR